MPVVVLASPKGGVGKSTCSVLLATEMARMGVDVTIVDCDPNRSTSRWASRGLPERVTIQKDIGQREIVSFLKSADGEGRLIVVDLEGIASQLVSRAISQADLVIVPMSPTALDAEVGSEGLALVREEEETLGRSIPHAVVLVKTSAAMKTRVQRELESNLVEAGIDVIQPSLVNRNAFSELFAYGQDLTAMLQDSKHTTGGNVQGALENATAFAEAVYERLK